MPVDYIRVRITPSRVAKGLLAIPVSLRQIFPKDRRNVLICFDDSKRFIEKPFSPYESTTRECRVYGLSSWYNKHNAVGGEYVVITVLDEAQYTYRFSFEKFYLLKKDDFQNDFIGSRSEGQAERGLLKISEWTGKDKEGIALAQYEYLSTATENELRSRIFSRSRFAREGIPYSMKVIVKELYKGHCQICDFSFLKRDGWPYFEIHHVEAEKGHHPKNILCVCANCHRQFEHANTNIWFNTRRWIIRVKFNDRVFTVNQILCRP